MSRLTVAALLLFAATLILAAPLRVHPERDLIEKEWGAVTDPDNDCTVRLDDGKLRIAIPGKPHVMTAEIGQTNSPRVLREVEGDFTMEVKVSGHLPGDARSLLQGRWPYYGAGLLVWQDDKNYVRFERACMHYPMQGWRCYPAFEHRAGGKLARGWQWTDGNLDDTKPAHFKLERKGESITGWFKQDGQNWTELPPISTRFGNKLRIGIVALQNTPSGLEAIFEGLRIAPAAMAKPK